MQGVFVNEVLGNIFAHEVIACEIEKMAGGCTVSVNRNGCEIFDAALMQMDFKQLLIRDISF